MRLPRWPAGHRHEPQEFHAITAAPLSTMDVEPHHVMDVRRRSSRWPRGRRPGRRAAATSVRPSRARRGRCPSGAPVDAWCSSISRSSRPPPTRSSSRRAPRRDRADRWLEVRDPGLATRRAAVTRVMRLIDEGEPSAAGTRRPALPRGARGRPREAGGRAVTQQSVVAGRSSRPGRGRGRPGDRDDAPRGDATAAVRAARSQLASVAGAVARSTWTCGRSTPSTCGRHRRWTVLDVPLTTLKEMPRGPAREPPLGRHAAVGMGDVVRVHASSGTTGRPATSA